MLDPELLFKLLERRDWDKFLGLLREHKEEIHGNPVAAQALNFFHDQFEGDIENDNICTTNNLNMIYLFHIGNYHKFPEAMFNKAMEKLLSRSKHKSLKEAYDLACTLPNVPFSNTIVAEYSKTQPVKIRHSQSNHISATHNREEVIVGETIKLFKSRQEQKFFEAMVSSFPNYHTYPNVAVSCLVDFDSIKGSLSAEQRGYFFRAIVDCVIFDITAGYKPKYFFEVDSVFHDTEEQIEKDKWKDKFFTLCGEKLFRIRAKSNNVSSSDFKKLIVEVIKEKI